MAKKANEPKGFQTKETGRVKTFQPGEEVKATPTTAVSRTEQLRQETEKQRGVKVYRPGEEVSLGPIRGSSRKNSPERLTTETEVIPPDSEGGSSTGDVGAGGGSDRAPAGTSASSTTGGATP